MFSPFPTRSLLVQHVTNLDTSKMCNQYGIKKGEPFFSVPSFWGSPPPTAARVGVSPPAVGSGFPVLTPSSFSFLPLQSDLHPRTSL